MSTQTETLKLALEALEYASLRIEKVDFDFEPEITAIKEALAQQSNEQVEPVAWIVHDRVAPDRLTFVEVKESLQTEVTPLYIIPKEKKV